MSGIEAPPVLREDHDGVVIVLLNRRAQRNALQYESWTELSAVLSSVTAEDDVTGLVIAGAGGFFSAGGDLKSGPAHGSGPFAPAGRVEHAQRVMEGLRSLPVPTVAAVEGAAVGIGWSLALSCDMVVAAEDAFFSAPFVARAVAPDGGLAWRLTRQLGRHRAATLLLRGSRLSAVDAEKFGLVNDVVAPGVAVERATAIVAELAGSDRGAVEMTKRLIESVEAAQLVAFQSLELAVATVAQQRSAASEGRAGY